MHPAVRWSAVGTGALILLFVLVCAIVAAAYGDPKAPLAGNRADPTLTVESPLRFAVLGDTQKGLASFDALLADVQRLQPAFLIHTGDLVSHNDEGHYRLARGHLAALRVPMFIVPGNHDIKGGTERFQRDFGGLEADFILAKTSFIVLNAAFGEAPDATAFERLLKKHEGRRTFVFTHVPPFDPKRDAFAAAAGWEPFVRMCVQHRVAYVFSGHAHTYVRREHEGVVFIANGVGGDRESWQYNQKAMATMVDVDANSIQDRAVEVEPRIEMKVELEHLAVGHVTEAYRSMPLLTWPATLAMIAVVVWLVVSRRKPPEPAALPAK